MRKLLVTLFFATAAFTGAAHGQFCPGATPYVFTDVPASDAFCGYITWMAATGVTTGCQVIDANNRLYCPDDFVTRKQMAAFMKRQADAVMPLTCVAGQVMKWNGAAWTCADDNIGGGSGTVSSVLAGTGLQASPNPIVGAGSINLAPSYQLPQACANGQVPKSNGAGVWACAADNDTNSGGTVTSVIAGAGLSGGTITTTGTLAVDTNTVQSRVVGACTAGSSIRSINSDGSVICDAWSTNASAPPVWVDANGRIVGPAIYPNGPAHWRSPYGNAVLDIYFDPPSNRGVWQMANSVVLYFASPDCSGQPYAITATLSGAHPVRFYWLNRNQYRLVQLDRQATPSVMPGVIFNGGIANVTSLAPQGSGATCAITQISDQELVIPANDSVGDVRGIFVGPFRVQ